MNTLTKRLIIIAMALIIPVLTMIYAVEYYSFNNSYYMEEFEKYKIIEITGIEEEALMRITDKLTGYLKNSESDLIINELVNGIEEQIFEDREIKHMVDVKVIFRVMAGIKWVLLVLVALGIWVLKYFGTWRDVFKPFLWASVIFTTILAALGFMIITDFGKYFVIFHEIFFTNDLWLLDPRTDILIQMLPQNFFVDIATSIVLTAGMSLYLVTSTLAYVTRRKND